MQNPVASVGKVCGPDVTSAGGDPFPAKIPFSSSPFSSGKARRGEWSCASGWLTDAPPPRVSPELLWRNEAVVKCSKCSCLEQCSPLVGKVPSGQRKGGPEGEMVALRGENGGPEGGSLAVRGGEERRP